MPFFRINLLLILSLAIAGGLHAQSTDQNYPSPVTENEVEGTIRARDIGDARLTSHFWAFDGSQGDIFINVVATNFSGDIDVYQAESLKPLTKMVVFADAGTTETGRVIYMRQPGRLLLRVEGRTPNDDPASYRIKFAGSFVALAPQKEVRPPTVGETEDTGIRVNSVGTIVAVRPRSTPTPTVARSSPSDVATDVPARRADNEDKPEVPASAVIGTRAVDPAVQTVFGNKSAKVTVTTPEEKVGRNDAATKPSRITSARRTTSRPPNPRAKTEPEPDPLANVRLVILLKDGNRIEKGMTEVLRFSYDRGFLTVVGRDGGITRYSMVNIASVMVQ